MAFLLCHSSPRAKSVTEALSPVAAADLRSRRAGGRDVSCQLGPLLPGSCDALLVPGSPLALQRFKMLPSGPCRQPTPGRSGHCRQKVTRTSGTLPGKLNCRAKEAAGLHLKRTGGWERGDEPGPSDSTERGLSAVVGKPGPCGSTGDVAPCRQHRNPPVIAFVRDNRACNVAQVDVHLCSRSQAGSHLCCRGCRRLQTEHRAPGAAFPRRRVGNLPVSQRRVFPRCSARCVAVPGPAPPCARRCPAPSGRALRVRTVLARRTFRVFPPPSLGTQQPLRPGSCRARRRVRRTEPHPAAFFTFGGGRFLRRRLLAEMRSFCPRPPPGDGVSFLAVIAEPRPAARQFRPGLPGAAEPALPVPSWAAVRGDAVGLRAPSRRPCASSAALARCASPAGRWEAGGKPEIRKQLISAGASGAFILTGQRLAPCTEESE